MAITESMSIEDLAYVEYLKTLGRFVIIISGDLPKKARDGMIYGGFVDGFKGNPKDDIITDRNNPNREQRLVYIGAYRAGQLYAKNLIEA